mgnify:CR=1 FL=1
MSAFTRLAESDANAIIPAKIGVEQGLPASAKIPPNKIGYKKVFVFSLCGISLTITGSSKSRTPNSFNPITKMIALKNIPKYPPAKEIKTFPVIAHAIPIIENTTAMPITKNNI